MKRFEKTVFGFSLVELLVVIAIIGILATIAIPSYQAYIRKSRTAEAESNINAIAQYEEQYYSENNRYLGLGGNPATIPYPGNGSSGALTWNAADANWQELGTMFTNNTQVRFQYRVYAGQFTSTAGEPASPLASHVRSNTTMGLETCMGPAGFPNPPQTAAGNCCTNIAAGATPQTFGITPINFGNWFVVVALGNQYWTAGNANRTKCSLFVKVNDRPAIYKQDDTE